MDITINKIDRRSSEIVLTNCLGTSKLRVTSRGGIELWGARAEDLALANMEGHVDILTGALEGDVGLLKDGKVYLLSTITQEKYGYFNSFRAEIIDRYTSRFEVGGYVILAEDIYHNFEDLESDLILTMK